MDIRMRRAEITVDVTGAEPVKSKYMTSPVMPVTVVFTYFDSGRGWAAVDGFKIKKNGQPGQVWASATFREWQEWPDWVREMAEQVRPAGFPEKMDTSQP